MNRIPPLALVFLLATVVALSLVLPNLRPDLHASAACSGLLRDLIARSFGVQEVLSSNLAPAI